MCTLNECRKYLTCQMCTNLLYDELPIHNFHGVYVSVCVCWHYATVMALYHSRRHTIPAHKIHHQNSTYNVYDVER